MQFLFFLTVINDTSQENKWNPFPFPAHVMFSDGTEASGGPRWSQEWRRTPNWTAASEDPHVLLQSDTVTETNLIKC